MANRGIPAFIIRAYAGMIQCAERFAIVTHKIKIVDHGTMFNNRVRSAQPYACLSIPHPATSDERIDTGHHFPKALVAIDGATTINNHTCDPITLPPGSTNPQSSGTAAQTKIAKFESFDGNVITPDYDCGAHAGAAHPNIGNCRIKPILASNCQCLIIQHGRGVVRGLN